MKTLGCSLIIGGWCLLLPLQAAAFESVPGGGEEGTVTLFASACESIHPGEAKSSVRVRATDKASFKAVENIPELSEYRNSFAVHDFNVLVYSIVDNYLEDMTVKTTEQSENKLCVEVSGYLSSENILKAFNENFNKFEQPQPSAGQSTVKEESYPDSLEPEDAAAAARASSLQLPPKPQPQVKEEIRAEEVLSETVDSPAEKAVSDEEATVVFIDKTKFFNNTATSMYFNEIKEIVTTQRGVVVSKDKNRADYVVRAEVLKAKVDPINKQTSRMQMVLALELIDNTSGNSIVEHQNRFILFESSEDEQKVASNLMKKLLRKAGEQISSRIRIKDRRPVSDLGMEPVITPTNPSYQPNRRTAPQPIQ